MKKTYNKSLCVRGKYKNEYHKNIDRSMIDWGVLLRMNTIKKQ